MYISYISQFLFTQYRYSKCTLPKTHSSHLKMDGWNTIVSFWGPAQFQVRAVSFREGTLFVDAPKITKPGLIHSKTPQGWKGLKVACFAVLPRWKCVTRMGEPYKWPFNKQVTGVRITSYNPYMDVSENSGTPKSSILIRFSIINHPFWGTTIFGNTYKSGVRTPFIPDGGPIFVDFVRCFLVQEPLKLLKDYSPLRSVPAEYRYPQTHLASLEFSHQQYTHRIHVWYVYIHWSSKFNQI